MPDFTVEAQSGLTLADWASPNCEGAKISGQSHEATKPRAGHPHRYYQATVGVQVEIRALVGGALVADSGLGGRLFTAWFIEYPTSYHIAPVGVASYSARQQFTPPKPGHYTMVIRREGGGAFVFHFDATGP